MRRGGELFSGDAHPLQRRYEALRAYLFEGLPASEVARRFRYTPASIVVLATHLRQEGVDGIRSYFRDLRVGGRHHPISTSLEELVLSLRRQEQLSVYDIAQRLTREDRPVSHQTVWRILHENGVKRLPKRSATEEPKDPLLHPPVADIRELDLSPREVECRAPLLLLFAPFLTTLSFDTVVHRAGYPGSEMVPASGALRATLALKLLQRSRKAHVMPLADDEGLGLFAGLNVLPKTTFLSDYSWRTNGKPHRQLLEGLVRARLRDGAYLSGSFNMDFHTIRHYGNPDDTQLEKNYVPRRSQSVPSVAVAYAQEEGSEEMVYAKADVLKREKADEVLRFVEYWKRVSGKLPEELVFDSQMTTHPGLAELKRRGITFLTLRERQSKEVERVLSLPDSAWKKVTLTSVNREYRHPQVLEEKVEITGYPGKIRQIVARDMGKELPMFLLTNDKRRGPATLLSRYPLRTHVENSIREQIDAFRVDSLSSSVRLKVDMDVVLDVVGSAAYRWLGHQLRGWERATARRLWQTFLDRPGKIRIEQDAVVLRIRRFSRAPILLDAPVVLAEPRIPWLGGRKLRVEVTGYLRLRHQTGGPEP